MKIDDLPKNLQVDGVKMYTGKPVKETLSEKQCQQLEGMLLARLLEQESA